MPHDVFFEIGVLEHVSRVPAVSEELIRAEGSTIGAWIHAGAMMAEEVEIDGNIRDRNGYLDTARGDGLSRWAASELNEAKHGTTTSVVTLLFTRAAPGPATGWDAGAVFRSTSGVRFSIDQSVGWGDDNNDDKYQEATSVIVGPDANVGAGTILIAEAPLEGISVTNPEPARGGNIEEQDDQFVARLRDYGSRQRRCTVEAVRQGALEVERVREAAVFESIDSFGVPSGSVSLVIADNGGGSNAELETDVRLELRGWRPCGCYPDIAQGTPRMETISVQATWDTGVADTGSRDALIQAIVARVNRLKGRAAPDGSEPDPECLLTHDAIKEVRPLIRGLKKLVVLIPIGTVEPDFGEVIRTDDTMVTVS